MHRLLEAIRSHIRYKIVLPYLALTLLVMTVGAAIATALVASSWEDRLKNELTQIGRNTTEALVQRERDYLAFLWQIAFAQENPAVGAPAMSVAFAAGDPALVATALRPWYENGIKTFGLNFDRMIAFDRDGKALVDWLRVADDKEPAAIDGTDLSQVAVVQKVLNGVQTDGNDKYSGLIVFTPDPQPYFYTIVPVKQGATIVGGLLLAQKVDGLLSDLQKSSQAAITTFYNLDGTPIGSTLLRREDELPTFGMPEAARLALADGRAQSIQRVLVREREYQLAYSPLAIANKLVGYFSVGISRDFQVSALTLSRNSIIAITLSLTAGAMLIGVWIARMITRPLTALVRAAEAVTAGDLERRTSIHTGDELERLSRAFNQMTEHLLGLYHTSRALSETIDIGAALDVTADAVEAFAPGTEVLALFNDRGTWRYWLRPDASPALHALRDVRLPPDDPLLREIADTRTARLVPADEPLRFSASGLRDVAGFQSLLLTPLVLQDELAGVLVFGQAAPDAFSEANEASLLAVANMAGSVLCNALLFERVTNESGERQAILASIADGIVVCDTERDIVLMNHAAEEMLQTPDWRTRRYNFDDLPLQRHRAGDLFGAAGPMSHYAIGDRVVSMSSAPVITEDGRTIGEVIALHDISSESAVDRAKTDFIATISHELRTPLTVISGYTELLLRGMVGELSSEQRDLLEQVRARSEHMSTLFRNVIMVASIEANTLRTMREPQDLWLAVESAAAPLRSAFAKKGLELHNQVPPDLPPILADREHLLLIMTQLLDNARRYTVAGSVTVSAARVDDEIQIDVTDTGPGIPPDELGKLFTRFHRVEGNSSPERGSGLGLAITRQLVERQGGRVWVRSEVGHGSTFSFSLPIANGRADAVIGPENANTTA